ncbi:hypothetical protein G7Y79_00021g050750 [Physcia stellaris]|nr:hypothetical protein G7Y79_00021g050750 [Physcia stellaris]
MNKLILILAAAALGNAVPTTSPSYKLTQVSTFDNIQGVPGVGIGPVGNNGIAYDLGFLGFSLAATTSPNAPPAGLVPESAPNEIAFGPTDPQTITAGFAQITVNYQESQIAYFDLSYFYYGCGLATVESAAGVNTACSITVTGFSPPPASKQVAQQTFKFVFNGGTVQNLMYAQLDPSFKGLYSAKFTVVNANPLLTATTVGVIDTVKNTIYSTDLIPGSP